MPIYEYQCNACGHRLETIQKMSDAPLTHCPECQKESLQKLVSAAGFQLKGTGWYATDFKDKGKKPAPSATDNTSSENKTSTPTTTETKPSSSTETKS